MGTCISNAGLQNRKSEVLFNIVEGDGFFQDIYGDIGFFGEIPGRLVGADERDIEIRELFMNVFRFLPAHAIGKIVIEQEHVGAYRGDLLNAFGQGMGGIYLVIFFTQVAFDQHTQIHLIVYY